MLLEAFMQFLSYEQLWNPDFLCTECVGATAQLADDFDYFDATGRCIRLRLATRGEIHAAEREVPILFHRSTDLAICVIVRRVSADEAVYVFGALRFDVVADRQLATLFIEWILADLSGPRIVRRIQ